MKQVCKLCNCYMLSHPKLQGWLKCIACGFCKKDEESQFVKAAREVMNKHVGLLKKIKESED